MKLGILTSHPIQYQVPLFRELACQVDLKVYFAHRQTAEGQAKGGYGVAFEWDIDLLSGYSSEFLANCARNPNVFTFNGCDTPDIAWAIHLEKFDAFLVTGWYLKSYWQAIRACRRFGVPIMVRGDSQLGTQRSLFKRFAKELLYRWLMGQFDRFLYVGKRNLEYLLHYGASQEHCFFSPHFVDNEWFKNKSAISSEQRRTVRQRLGAGPSDVVLLSVGRLVAMKRPLDLLRAARLLREQSISVRVVYVGAGPLGGAIEKEAKALGVQATMAGFRNQSELPQIYASADLLVLCSSSSETWGLVVNEAMACGTPAVVSDAVGCGPDMVEQGKTGCIYPVGDVQALAGAVKRMLLSGIPEKTRQELKAKLQGYSVERAAAGVMRVLSSMDKDSALRSK